MTAISNEQHTELARACGDTENCTRESQIEGKIVHAYVVSSNPAVAESTELKGKRWFIRVHAIVYKAT